MPEFSEFDLPAGPQFAEPTGDQFTSFDGPQFSVSDFKKKLLDSVQVGKERTMYGEYQQPVTKEDRIASIAAQKKALYGTDEDAFMRRSTAEEGLGQVLNTAGALVSGTGSLVDSIASIPSRAIESGKALLRPVDQAIKEAVPDLYGTLNRSIGGANPFIRGASDMVSEGFKGVDIAGDMLEDFTSKFHNATEMNRVAADLGEEWDASEGAIETIMNMGATVVSNPAVAAEMAAQSLPQMMALATKGDKFAIAFMGMMGDRVEESTKIYQDSHDGALPEGADQLTLLGTSALSTVIEAVESKFVLNKLGKAKPKAKPDVAEAKSLLKKGTDLPIVKTGVKAVASGGAEIAQEASGQILTELGGKQTLDVLTDPEALKEAAIAGAQGFGAGALMGGGAQAVQDVGKISEKPIAKVVSKAADVVKSFEGSAIEKAEREVTEAKRDKTPEKGIDAITRMDLTKMPTEDRRKKLKDLAALTVEYEAQIETLEDGDAKTTAEAKATDYKATFDQLVEAHNKIVAEESTDAVSTFVPTEVEEGTTEEVVTPTSVEAKAAAKEVVEAIQTADMPLETAKKVFGSTLFKESTTAAERKAMDIFIKYKESTEAVIKNPLSVNHDIMTGTDGFKGLPQYISDMKKLVALKDKTAARNLVRDLTAFRVHQEVKLAGPNPQTGRPHTIEFAELLKSEINAIEATKKQVVSMAVNVFGIRASAIKTAPAPKVEAVAEVIPETRAEIVAKVRELDTKLTGYQKLLSECA